MRRKWNLNSSGRRAWLDCSAKRTLTRGMLLAVTENCSSFNLRPDDFLASEVRLVDRFSTSWVETYTTQDARSCGKSSCAQLM